MVRQIITCEHAPTLWGVIFQIGAGHGCVYVVTSCDMATRKSPDLTIRLAAAERATIDRAAHKRGERGVSSWARTVLLREAAKETDQERSRRVARLIATMRSGIPGAAAHAAEVERSRSEDWKREDR